MACFFTENVHTKSFTPREFQVELLDSAKERNIVVCLNPGTNKTFIALKLLQELSNSIRGSKLCKRTLYIGNERSVEYFGNIVRHLTDLVTGKYVDTSSCFHEEDQVLTVTYEVCQAWLSKGVLNWKSINVVIIEDCHYSLCNHPLRQIIINLKDVQGNRPKILGLTTPLFSNCDVEPGCVEAQVKRLELDLKSKVDTASDIVSILRYSAHPKELLVVCDNPSKDDLMNLLESEVRKVRLFLDDHRYDPFEIYDESFSDELKDIPDPKTQPNSILDDFIEILHTMGAWCADKAAMVLAVDIEKLKVKTPYERHFLLLCLVSSLLFKIRAFCDEAFQGMTELEKINKFSSPRVLRLVEIVRQFKPKKPIDCIGSSDTGKDEKIVIADDGKCESETKNNEERNKCEEKLENEPKTDHLENSNLQNENHEIEEKVDGSVKKRAILACFVCGKVNCSGSNVSKETDTCTDDNNEICKNNTEVKSPSEVQLENSINRWDRHGELSHHRPNSRWKGRGRSYRLRRGGINFSSRHYRNHNTDDTESLCGIIFVQKRFTAKILYHLFNDLHKNDPDFVNIVTLYTVNKTADPNLDPREAEVEHRKQEDVLKRFRMRECNLVIATSVLEEGIELPRCNLIVRYDLVTEFKSHAHCKGRARQQISYYILLVEKSLLASFMKLYSKFICTEKILLGRTMNHEPSESEEQEADLYNHCVPYYQPVAGKESAKVDLSNAIALVNRYCAKLPSDTFTRLVPLWNTREVVHKGRLMYYTTVRLPINSPIKEDIIGHPMHSKVLARRIAALETSRVLHLRGELDDNLEPIGKEAFNSGIGEEDLTPSTWDPNLPRPGTTKSRQYYYKKIASCLNDCRPIAGVEVKLYSIDMDLTCPLPEEQNTRGRKLHPPELAVQGFGILTMKTIPKICPFPIFTRSGEVRVNLRLCSSSIVLSEHNVETITAFLNFIFTSVLRLQKYLMSFDPEATENSFFIVPTKKVRCGINVVDWEFLETIYKRRHESPQTVPEEERKSFTFDPSMYRDAVVMPWYRNQDQPQYFYVAEICNHLNPKSEFPGSDYSSFEDYYKKKYGIQIQNSTQPLLDVDHTSARLNFLTPRYVNRKGVALPTSSEETKRAKRENLEQKQILVAELCLIHVVPASLWRQAVCLPCILYRINALLLADEIRTTVAKEVSLGLIDLPAGFTWSPLDFGWSLADVLKKSKEQASKKDEDDEGLGSNTVSPSTTANPENKQEDSLEIKEVDKETTAQSDEESKPQDWMEIGTWSNEMAQLENQLDLPPNLTMVRYGSPTSWEVGGNMTYDYYYSDAESDDSSDDFDISSENSDDNSSCASTGLKITFQSDYIAEAVDDEEHIKRLALVHQDYAGSGDAWSWDCDNLIEELKMEIEEEVKIFQEQANMIEDMETEEALVHMNQPLVINRAAIKENSDNESRVKQLDYEVESYSMPEYIAVDKSRQGKEPYENNHTDEKTTDQEESEDEVEFIFSFDKQPDLKGHPGPSPSLLLQALTMSNANDGINLERLETIGDSFLKYAITTYLYCTHENIHEGKLSHLRSKQVSNLKLYRLGQNKVFGESMIASKFEPHDNWLPPCYLVPRDAEQELVDQEPVTSLPYNLVTQHSIPDKSIADCVEALIGAYLIECGPRGALIFMSWLGIKVLPKEEVVVKNGIIDRPVGSYLPVEGIQVRFGMLQPPKSPLLRHVEDPEGELLRLMAGFDSLERKLKYSFRDKSFLLQAMTHTSYSPNRLTDCYQRLEFLGDAVLDYLITRHLYEDKRAHSPGSLTDLRSALVNNTIFASLAVKHGLHKYFRHLSPGLGEVIQRFVTIQEQTSHAISEEYYLVGGDAEDVEVPKALGDVFESVAGAIFLDSDMSLDTVWNVYYRMMKKEIEQFSTKVPKSPIRELLELEPETAKFSKPEKLADGRRVRVTVEVFGKGTFKGIGRNYRIAKCTAAKCALKQLKKKGLLARKLCYFNSYPFHQA
ncbi:endoribonuclease Dcr-1 [Cimex lectularius]|uniref:ribonuclease III n=1 Tax=Cimex lectularius TaxID=79782 RepID=A0A8I6RVQ9_CIMLE|nr:endoribonuclease Dcr-1 [Cimex lectularius]